MFVTDSHETLHSSCERLLVVSRAAPRHLCGGGMCLAVLFLKASWGFVDFCTPGFEAELGLVPLEVASAMESQVLSLLSLAPSLHLCWADCQEEIP